MHLLRNLWSKAKTYAVLLVSGVAGILFIALRVVSGQKHEAQQQAEQANRRAENAEARIVQRQKAETANQAAKTEGEKHVQDAIDRARTGDRSHFE